MCGFVSLSASLLIAYAAKHFSQGDAYVITFGVKSNIYLKRITPGSSSFFLTHLTHPSMLQSTVIGLALFYVYGHKIRERERERERETDRQTDRQRDARITKVGVTCGRLQRNV